MANYPTYKRCIWRQCPASFLLGENLTATAPASWSQTIANEFFNELPPLAVGRKPYRYPARANVRVPVRYPA